MFNQSIGSALTTALETFVHTSRRTGRTTQMLDTVCNMPKDAPVAIVTSVHQEVRRLQLMLRDRNRPDVQVFHLNPTNYDSFTRLHRSEYHIVFDHLFAEAWWRHEIHLMSQGFARMQDDFSRIPKAYQPKEF